MILAYILADVGGSPLLVRTLKSISSNDHMMTLFSSAIAAISSVIKEALKQNIRHLELEKFHIYIASSGDFVLALISDKEDENLYALSESIVTSIAKRYTADEVNFNPGAKDEAIKLIEDMLSAMEIVSLEAKELAANIIAGLPQEAKGAKLSEGLPTKPKQSVFKPSPSSVAMTDLLFRLADLDVALKTLSLGEFSEALNALLYLSDKDERARIIAGVLGLLMRLHGPKIPAPEDFLLANLFDSLSEPYKTFFLDYLKLFRSVTAAKDLANIVKAKEFLRNLDSFVKCAVIALYPVNFLEECRHYLDEYPALLSLLESSYALFFTPLRLKSFGELITKLGFLRGDEELYKGYPEVVALLYSLLALEAPRFKETPADLVTSLVAHLRTLRAEILKKAESRSYLTTAYWLFNALYFSLIEDVLWSLTEKLKGDELKAALDESVKLLRILEEDRLTGRVLEPVYLVAKAAILARIARASRRINYPFFDVVSEVYNVLSDELESMYQALRLPVALHVVSAVEALGHSAHFIKAPDVRREMFRSVGELLLKLSAKFRDDPTLYLITRLKAAEFLIESGFEGAVSLGKSVIEDLEKVSPVFRAICSAKVSKDARKLGRESFKVLILGDSGVGKTSIIQKFFTGRFSTESMKTMGVDVFTKEMPLKIGDNEVLIRWVLWDVAGDRRWKDLHQYVYRGVNAVILVYDVTRKETLANVKKWLKEVMKYCKNFAVILVGNKVDLRGNVKGTVNPEDGEKLRKSIENELGRKVPFIETSALTGHNIDKLFEMLGKMLVKTHHSAA